MMFSNISSNENNTNEFIIKGIYYNDENDKSHDEHETQISTDVDNPSIINLSTVYYNELYLLRLTPMTKNIATSDSVVTIIYSVESEKSEISKYAKIHFENDATKLTFYLSVFFVIGEVVTYAGDINSRNKEHFLKAINQP